MEEREMGMDEEEGHLKGEQTGDGSTKKRAKLGDSGVQGKR